MLKALDQVRLVREATQAQQQVAAFRHELDLAHSIQQSILPQEWPTLPGVDLYARMIPARTVGGDFFDFFVQPGGRLGVVVGDVSGKGIPAAFFMAICRSLLRSIAGRELTPGDAIQETNRLICEDNRTDLFVTLFYGVLDPATGRFDFANAGHNAPYRFTPDGQITMLAAEECRGTVVGVVPTATFATCTAQLGPGEGIVLYTDGDHRGTRPRRADVRRARPRSLPRPRARRVGPGDRREPPRRCRGIRPGHAAVGRSDRPRPAPRGRARRSPPRPSGPRPPLATTPACTI